jgi:glucose dehydrogenase
MAAGTFNGGISAIAESWNGAAWLYQMPSPPQPEPFLQPAGLSCTGPAACVAVGTDGRTPAEIWAGTHRGITPTPSP